MIQEFGSDFHRCDHDFRGPSNFFDVLGCTRMYACGRHAIDALVRQEGWKRIWIPAYFCNNVIRHIRQNGVEVMFYDDNPLCENDNEIVRELPYKNGDVLLRVQYFGLRKWRTNKGIPVPVVEDHTHDLISDWALKSNADWCIASLRKILPVAAGGILWSPKGKVLPDALAPTDECKHMASIRYEAMSLKSEYLKYGGDKEAFRAKFIDSEVMIENLPLSGIDYVSGEITMALDIKRWTDLKLDNWLLAVKRLDSRVRVLGKENENYWHPLSLILLMESAEERESMRKYLIQHNIYPAVLWSMPEGDDFAEARDFSGRMLSVHCDIRYCRDAIEQMCTIINGYYDTNL